MVAFNSSPQIARLARELAGAFHPRTRPVRSEWCCQHLRFPSKGSAGGGSFSLRGREYFREPLDAIDDPNVSEIVVPGGTQPGKTAFVKAIILSQGEIDRAPMMFVGVDQIHAREERDSIYTMAEESPILKRRIPPKRLRNDRAIDLFSCLAYLAWAGSPQRLSGRACKKVICSEVDRYPRHSGAAGDTAGEAGRINPIHLARQRPKAFKASSTVIIEGTPVGVSPTLWPAYKKTDRRRYHVPCPKCGAHQELRFFVHKGGEFGGRGGIAGLKDGKGNWKTADEARRDAYYLCINGCRIESSQKAAMIRRGVWVPEGQSVTKAGRLVGTPKNPGRRRGYHVPSLLSPTISFGAIAEEYLSVRDTEDGLTSFFNDWLGLPWAPRGKMPRWQDLGARLAGGHLRGTIPSWVYFLIAAADVQERGVWWLVRGFGDQKTSALIDFGFIARQMDAGDDWDPEEDVADDLAQLVPLVLSRRWPVLGETPEGESSLMVKRLGINQTYRKTDVRTFIRQNPGPRVLGVFGDSKIGSGTLYRPMKAEVNTRTGRQPKGYGAPRFWGLDVNGYKTETADRWFMDRSKPGAWWLPSDILETAGGEDYLRQIVSESRVRELVGGRPVVRWKLPSHSTPNHLWDDEVYAAGLADISVGGNWDAKVWAQQSVAPGGWFASIEGKKTGRRRR